MEITLPLSSFIIIAVGSVGVIVAIVMGGLLLSHRKKKHFSITVLACLLIVSGLTLLNDLLTTSGLTNRIQQLYFIPIYYSLSIPPLFYLFIKSKFKYRLAASDYLHLVIPAAQALVYFTIGFRSVAFKSELYMEVAFRTYLTVETLLFPLSLFVYTLLAIALLKRNNEPTSFWSADMRQWLYRFSMGMLGIGVIELAFFLLATQNITSSDLYFYMGHTAVLSAFVFWIAINGFKQYYPMLIFTSKPGPEAPLIDDPELSQLVDKLQQLMERDKVYLHPDLNLALLAHYLGISEKRCSYVLNKGLGVNFNQYINQLRVEAFKARIQEGQHTTYTLTSIAYECGFESKSTFNRVFKSTVGMTPSAFVKKSQSSA